MPGRAVRIVMATFVKVNSRELGRSAVVTRIMCIPTVTEILRIGLLLVVREATVIIRHRLWASQFPIFSSHVFIPPAFFQKKIQDFPISTDFHIRH